jgi:hypothetical protein
MKLKHAVIAIRMKNVLLLSLALLCISPAAHATSIVSFEFSNLAGDQVVGRIFGLVDNANNQAASSILIDSFTGQVGGEFGTATNDVTNWASQIANLFSISAGEITAATFAAQDAAASLGTFCINLPGCISSTSLLQFQSAAILIGNSTGFSGVAFGTLTTVPEPASVILLLIGILGLTAVRSCKQF